MKSNFILKLFKFLHSIFYWIILGCKFPNKNVLKNRKKVCYGCEKWRSNLYGPIGGCSICGCSVIKLYLKTESCPIRKW